ncbi:hypothetical protein ACH47Z_30200 [Streptomyces sp. NPDC020192]|uniref:hypothetical protein n=1 Tax=Streptomyces sp. NPDC020192 TaxID=3365066 RepID=UPI0037AD3894
MNSTWAARDLPVLDTLVKFLDDAAGESFPHLRDIAELTDLEVIDVGRAAIALEGAGLIDLRKVMGGDHGHWFVTGVSGHARHLVGQWPSAEQFVDEVASRLDAAADDETDPERRSRLRELASSAGDVARSVFVDVATAVISKQMGV